MPHVIVWHFIIKRSFGLDISKYFNGLHLILLPTCYYTNLLVAASAWPKLKVVMVELNHNRNANQYI